MEDGLVHKVTNGDRFATASLNPCCNGRWSRTKRFATWQCDYIVLILVVMEDGLVLNLQGLMNSQRMS